MDNVRFWGGRGVEHSDTPKYAVDLYRYLAIPQRCGGVRVIALQPRFSRDPIETLTADQFIERSAVNGVKWIDTGAEMLTTTVDRHGVTIMESRFQIR